MDLLDGLGPKLHGAGVQATKSTVMFLSPPATSRRFIKYYRVFQ